MTFPFYAGPGSRIRLGTWPLSSGSAGAGWPDVLGRAGEEDAGEHGRADRDQDVEDAHDCGIPAEPLGDAPADAGDLPVLPRPLERHVSTAPALSIPDFHPQPALITLWLAFWQAVRLASLRADARRHCETYESIQNVVEADVSCPRGTRPSIHLVQVRHVRSKKSEALHESGGRVFRKENLPGQPLPRQLGMELHDPPLKGRRHRGVDLPEPRYDAPHRKPCSAMGQFHVKSLKIPRRGSPECGPRRGQEDPPLGRPAESCARNKIALARVRANWQSDRHVDYDRGARFGDAEYRREVLAQNQFRRLATGPVAADGDQPTPLAAIHARDHVAAGLCSIFESGATPGGEKHHRCTASPVRRSRALACSSSVRLPTAAGSFAALPLGH